MFSSSAYGPGAVRWLQPVRRRRRRRLPVGPILAAIVLLALAAGAFAFVRSRDDGEDPSRAIAQRFADAWARGDLARAWALTTAQTQSQESLAGFRESIRQATRAATVERTEVGRAGVPRGGVVPVPVVMRTRLFGELRGTIAFPVERSGETARVAWEPRAAAAGAARRASACGGGSCAGRGALRCSTPAARAWAASPPRRRWSARRRRARSRGSGLEAMYDERLGGLPGAELRYGRRLIARVAVVARASGEDHDPARAAGGGDARARRPARRRRGPAAARRQRARARRAGGLGPAAAGLGVQDHHALRGAAGARDDARASRSRCGRRRRSRGCGCAMPATRRAAARLTDSFAHSCNSVFAPLGARLGAKRLVAYAERFGFNERLPIPAAKPSTIPPARELTDDLAVGASAIGQDRDLATPLVMASVGATIANGGVRARPRLVRSEKRVRRRVVKRRVARQVRDMMLEVVRRGTGTAAALPGVDVAGKTGTAELVPTADGPSDPSNTDAWFVAFAPASAPRLAVAVMLVGAGQGGASAAPIAREVLSAGL